MRTDTGCTGIPSPLQLGGRLIDVGREVGLREEQHGSRTAFPGEREVPLEKRLADLLADRGDDEHDVDVRRDDLLTHVVRAGLVRCAARELRASREDRPDRRLSVVRGIERDPVADDGKLRPRLDLAPRPGREPGAGLSVLGEDVVGAAVLDGYPARVEPGSAVRSERVRPAVVPAEGREVEHTPIVANERIGSTEGRWTGPRSSRPAQTPSYFIDGTLTSIHTLR